MAVVAESASVIYGKPEFWEERKRLDVVCFKISTSIVSAILTSKAISLKDRFPPQFVFYRCSNG